MHLEINPQAEEPVYQQIVRQIRQLICDGLLEPGVRLPSMRELARQTGVSVNTVHAAIDALSTENLIVAKQGGGTYVTEHVGVATGTNLRTREDLGRDNGRPGFDWSKYAFPTEFFMAPLGKSDVIDFARASPDPTLYPFERIKQTVTNMLWNPQELFFNRGHPQGYLPLVDHLEKEMALLGIAMAEGENDILLTGGFQRALSMLLNVLVKPGQKVAIESPTYAGIVNLLLAEKIPFVTVPVDEEGIDTQLLEGELQSGDVAAIVTIPTFHNPTGASLSEARRARLLGLAEQYAVPVIEDDWARALRYEGVSLPPLKSTDESNCVIYVGTYSKCFLPGLRLGWVVAPSQLAKTLVYSKLGADNGDSFFLQALMHEFIRHGFFAKHLRHSNGEYRNRRDLMCGLLDEHLPPGCSFVRPEGGLFIWLSLPKQVRSVPLLTLARKAGVTFMPATHCTADRSDMSALRLSFSRVDATEIEKGIPKLCQVLAECLAHPEMLEES